MPAAWFTNRTFTPFHWAPTTAASKTRPLLPAPDVGTVIVAFVPFVPPAVTFTVSPAA